MKKKITVADLIRTLEAFRPDQKIVVFTSTGSYGTPRVDQVMKGNKRDVALICAEEDD